MLFCTRCHQEKYDFFFFFSILLFIFGDQHFIFGKLFGRDGCQKATEKKELAWGIAKRAFCTLFQTKVLKNHILSTRTHLYRLYRGNTPPLPRPHGITYSRTLLWSKMFMDNNKNLSSQKQKKSSCDLGNTWPLIHIPLNTF